MPQRLKDWYRWRANTRSRNANNHISSKDLRRIYRTDRTRDPKAYEVFAGLFPDVVKPVFEGACAEKGATGRNKLPIWHSTAKTLWSQATHEQQQAVNAKLEEKVEEPTNALSKMLDLDEDNTPESYQQYENIFLYLFDAVFTFLQLSKRASKYSPGNSRSCLPKGRHHGRAYHCGTGSQIRWQDQYDVVGAHFLCPVTWPHPSLSH